jgi:hypothetical protein
VKNAASSIDTIALLNANMPTARQVDESAKEASSNNNDNNSQRGASVHLEGFADAVPSPMAVAPKVATATAIPAAAQQPPSKPSQSPSQKVEAARKASNSLLQSALLSSLESSYTSLQSERDALQCQLSEALSAANAVKLENASLKSAHEESTKSMEERGKRWRGEVSSEREKREEAEKKLRWCEERCLRLEGEGDSLRGEIRCVLAHLVLELISCV